MEGRSSSHKKPGKQERAQSKTLFWKAGLLVDPLNSVSLKMPRVLQRPDVVVNDCTKEPIEEEVLLEYPTRYGKNLSRPPASAGLFLYLFLAFICGVTFVAILQWYWKSEFSFWRVFDRNEARKK